MVIWYGGQQLLVATGLSSGLEDTREDPSASFIDDHPDLKTWVADDTG